MWIVGKEKAMQRKRRRASSAIHVLGATHFAAALTIALSLGLGNVEAQQAGPARFTMNDAIRLAIEHNHALQAARTTIRQSEAEEITAGLRPNRVLSGDYNFVPVLSPSYFGAPFSQVPLPQEGDASLAYTLELGGKRRSRLEAARNQSAVTRSTVADSERNLNEKPAMTRGR